MTTPTEIDRLIITIIYDNNAYDPRLKTAWGFSALVEYRGHTILFDTGGDAPTLLDNMRILEIDPTQIEHIVISHNHGDHTGGLEGLLASDLHPTVYVPSTYPFSSRKRITPAATVVEAKQAQSVTEDLSTTGEMQGDAAEQALVVRTDKGLVVITGCAHPGVVQMLQRAQTLYGGPVHLVLGGFHLRDKPDTELESILAAFRRMGVEKVAPCHCTGDQAIQMFLEAYDDDFIQAGAGRVIVVEP